VADWGYTRGLHRQIRACKKALFYGGFSKPFWIVADATKGAEARSVPIHDHLIRQGLLDYVASRGKRPLFYDPKRSRGGKDSNPHHQKVAERLAEWVRELGIEVGVAPNHGWAPLLFTGARRRHAYRRAEHYPGARRSAHRRKLRRRMGEGGQAGDFKASPVSDPEGMKPSW
jgi:hypothetical protein